MILYMMLSIRPYRRIARYLALRVVSHVVAKAQQQHDNGASLAGQPAAPCEVGRIPIWVVEREGYGPDGEQP